jgi:crotonobetainyl-CoA:carnitine CoA-transferase CaiB-like acyl-CoA transferase
LAVHAPPQDGPAKRWPSGALKSPDLIFQDDAQSEICAKHAQPPIVPIVDNVVAWLGTTGILGALRRRAIEGGSYRVVISLTRTVLWFLSLGIFDKAYAKATAGSTDEHTYIAPDLFTAETPLGTYQGMTDQIVMSRTPGAFRTALAPRGSSKPEWLPLRS